MSGVTFFVWLTQWIFLCFLASIFVQLKSRPPCRREFKKGRKKHVRKQSRGQCVSFQQAWTKRNILPFVPYVSNIPRNPQLDSASVEGAAGNCRRDIVQNRVPNPETCSQVLKRDNQSQRVLWRNCNGALPTALCLTVVKEPWATAGRTMSKATRLRVQGGCGKLQRKLDNPTTNDQAGPP